MSYSAKTFYIASDILNVRYAKFLENKFYDDTVDTDASDNTDSKPLLSTIYIHATTKIQILSDLYDEIKELDGTIDSYLTDTDLDCLIPAMILKNVLYVFTGTEQYNTDTQPYYQIKYNHYKKDYENEWTKAKNKIKTILGINNNSIKLLK